MITPWLKAAYRRQIAALDEIANSSPCVDDHQAKEAVDLAYQILTEAFGELLVEAELAEGTE